MATSDAPGFGPQDGRQTRHRSLTRYDLVLLVIPVVLAASLLASLLTPVSLTASLAAGSLVGTAVLVDALFRNPPTGSRRH